MRARNFAIALIAILVVACFATATQWILFESRPGPAPNMRGCSSPCIDVLTDGTPPRVWRVLSSGYGIPVPLNVPAGAWGLAWTGTEPGYVSNYDNGYIYRVNTSGSVLSSFRCPRGRPAGILWAHYTGAVIQVAIPDENLILYLTSTGSIVHSEPGPGTRVTAPANYFGYLCVGDAGTHKVYTYDGTFNVPSVAGLCTDTPMSGPYTYIWLTDAATNTLQRWGRGGMQPVGLSSLGRVKALYW
jgi:hypothetical protein